MFLILPEKIRSYSSHPELRTKISDRCKDCLIHQGGLDAPFSQLFPGVFCFSDKALDFGTFCFQILVPEFGRFYFLPLIFIQINTGPVPSSGSVEINHQADRVQPTLFFPLFKNCKIS